jgi:hypothetical protein
VAFTRYFLLHAFALKRYALLSSFWNAENGNDSVPINNARYDAQQLLSLSELLDITEQLCKGLTVFFSGTHPDTTWTKVFSIAM